MNASITTRLAEWTQVHVHSQLAFLLCLMLAVQAQAANLKPIMQHFGLVERASA